MLKYIHSLPHIMANEINKFLYWAPRILAILFICFVGMLSLDVFELSSDFWEIIVGLLIHNIPTFILIVLLILSWRREIVGAILFILFGIGYAIFMITAAVIFGSSWALVLSSVGIIGGPSILIGILFLINWRKK